MQNRTLGAAAAAAAAFVAILVGVGLSYWSSYEQHSGGSIALEVVDDPGSGVLNVSREDLGRLPGDVPRAFEEAARAGHATVVYRDQQEFDAVVTGLRVRESSTPDAYVRFEGEVYRLRLSVQ